MTAKDDEACLTAEVLQQLAHDELLPGELVDIEAHVSDCDRCRQLMDVAESDSQWQDEILPILRTSAEEASSSDENDDRDHNQHALDSVLRLLGPTDDPHKLGRIGTYEIVGIIGHGGMGVVFKAFDAALNRFVAIKMLLPHLAASGAARKRFAREGQAAAAVIDDHVTPIYNVAEWHGVPYLVTQYSRGTTLQKRIQDRGPLELKEILRISLQTARGLAAAHAQGLVHRDVKPSNILLDGTVERAMLTDFGLARAVDDASITRTGMISGTPQYMSPEQARGEAIDHRSDLFSLGSVIYAMSTGHPPFRADTTFGVLHRVGGASPRPMREINADVPEWLERIVSRLMSKRPEDRIKTATELATLLEQCLAHLQQPMSVSLPVGAQILSTASGIESVRSRRLSGQRTNYRFGLIALMMIVTGVFGFWLSVKRGIVRDVISDDPVVLDENNPILRWNAGQPELDKAAQIINQLQINARQDLEAIDATDDQTIQSNRKEAQ